MTTRSRRRRARCPNNHLSTERGLATSIREHPVSIGGIGAGQSPTVGFATRRDEAPMAAEASATDLATDPLEVH